MPLELGRPPHSAESPPLATDFATGRCAIQGTVSSAVRRSAEPTTKATPVAHTLRANTRGARLAFRAVDTTSGNRADTTSIGRLLGCGAMRRSCNGLARRSWGQTHRIDLTHDLEDLVSQKIIVQPGQLARLAFYISTKKGIPSRWFINPLDRSQIGVIMQHPQAHRVS